MSDKIKLESTFASLPKTTRGLPVVLSGDPTKNLNKGLKPGNLLYCNGNNVYVRNLNDATQCLVYSDHSCPATVAKFAPTGFYIASGDNSGKIRIWDTTNPENILKFEYQPLGGAVKDLAWDGESKRMAIVGEGRESYAKCILWDSGSSCGDMSGHNKSVNSVAIRQERPFKAVTASEDFTTQFYNGVPFKYVESKREHSNFVQCVRYHPKGDVFISVSADKKACVYDGKTAEFLGVLGGETSHNGGIYSVDFNDDGSEVLTVSGDKTARIWNVASRELVVEFPMGNDIEDMQLGCLWQGEHIITVSLSGYINYLDRNNPSKPKKIQKGHNKAITAMALTADRSTVYTGDQEGKIYYWDVKTGDCDIIQGKGHTNKVSDMVIVGNSLVSISMDDTLRITSISSNHYDSNSIKMPSQPQAVAATSDATAIVACLDSIVVVQDGAMVFQQQVIFNPSSVDIHPGGNRVAFGGSKRIHVFEFDGTGLKEQRKEIEFDTDDVTQVRYSPDGNYLAASTGSRRYVYLYKVEGDELKKVYKTTKQNGKIFCVSWSPDSQHFATGSLDGSIAVWCLDPKYDKSNSHFEKFAHKKAQVQNISWTSDREFISSSSDSCIKQWSVQC